MRKAVFLSLLLALALFIPQTRASSVVEKFPTSYREIKYGWDFPEKAYVKDGDCVICCLSTFAEVGYSGFGFNFNETDTIEAVWLKIKCYMYAGSVGNFVDFGTSVVPYSYVHVDSLSVSDVGNSGIEPERQTCVAVDFYEAWGLLPSVEQLNNFELLLLGWINWESYDYIHVDVVSVVVAYSVLASGGESEFPVGLGAGALLMSFVAVIAFSIKKKR